MDTIFSAEFIIIFFPLGMLAGVIAGMFGVGGGLIIVPVLYWILPTLSTVNQFPADKIMHVSIGTSLAIIVLTSLSSAWGHYKKNAIDARAFFLLVPGLLMGAALSAPLADSISNDILKVIFTGFELLVAIQMFFAIGVSAHRQLPGPVATGISGGAIGMLSGLVGIGGGTITVPFLSWCNYDIKRAIGTSAACGLPIAIAGMLGFMWIGNDSALPAGSTGYIFWPAFIGISAMSVLFAPLGVKLAHRLPAKTLKKLFSIFLLLLALTMMF